VDRVNAVEPAKSAFATKANVRRAIEAEGIPYTYVSSNFFSGYFLLSFNQPGATAPPRDKVVILGDGNPKGNVSQILLKIFLLWNKFLITFIYLCAIQLQWFRTANV